MNTAHALAAIALQLDELITAQRETLTASQGARTAAERSADAVGGVVTAIDQLTEKLAEVDARLTALELAHRSRTNGTCRPEGIR
jgi:methyl-accepting chemotaxis protein